MIDNVANFAVVTWLRFTRIPWSGSGPVASSTAGNGYNFIVQAADLSRCQDECVRPVGLAFDSRGGRGSEVGEEVGGEGEEEEGVCEEV